MIARWGAWGDVERGDYIASREGVTYKVSDELQGWLKLIDREGGELRFRRPAPEVGVTLMEIGESEALEVLHRILGARQFSRS